jgi:lipid-A-disaccharide synthase
MTPRHGPHVALLAGEPSGDALGARLMAALRAQTGDRVRFTGVGGARMIEAGLTSRVPMHELSVMGLIEVVPHLPRLRRHLAATVGALRADPPDAVVSIDSPGFTLRVQRALADLGAARIHYVAPQVWAWKAGRARRLARDLDLLLTLLPFEPPLFARHGLRSRFVGHPAIERAADAPAPEMFRARNGIPARAPLLCALPGSRRGEVDRLLPIFEATLARLATTFLGLHAVVPTVPGVERRVRAAVAQWPVPATVVTEPEAKAGAFAAADAALAASGTVATELAVAGTPTVIAYRMHPVSEVLARRLVKLDYASVPNLVLGREVQPEHLLERCTPDRLTPAVAALLGDGDARRRALADGRAVAAALMGEGGSPSRAAAREILACLGERRSDDGAASAHR